MVDRIEGRDGGKPHLRLDGLRRAVKFKGHQVKIKDKFRRDERALHGQMLLEQLAQALRAADSNRKELGVSEHLGQAGVFLSVERPSKLPEEKLERKQDAILAAVTPTPRREGSGFSERVAYFIPDDKRRLLEEQIAQYRDSEGQNKPNAVHKRFDEVDAILFAGLSCLWTSKAPVPEDDHEGWFELWLRRKEKKRDPDAQEWLHKRASTLEYEVSEEVLHFPKIVVRFVHAKGRTLKRLVLELGGQIAEVRSAQVDASVFTTVRRASSNSVDSTEWVENLRGRVTPAPGDSPHVALHDTGVLRAHPLLDGLLAADDLHARRDPWGTDDHDGHGTNMAGIAAYGDLQFPLQGSEPVAPPHRLESYKILPPSGQNPPNSYGLVVHDAISDLEIANATRSRVHCCTIAAQPCQMGHPSTWSSAIDQVTSGVANDDLDSRGPKRLWVQAVGNILPHEWQESEDHLDHPIEDPAQSWNAISVGGFTNRTPVTEKGYENCETFAAVGDPSPYSRTSLAWERGLTPQKPEVVFEAGNWVREPLGNYGCGFDSLSMLTTGRKLSTAPLECVDMTSPATALAAKFAAEIMAHNSNIWPETVRALMVHSAQWTPAMTARLKAAGSMEARAALVRQFGYGVPRLERALASKSTDVALFTESTIQPFRETTTKDPKSGKSTKLVGFNEAHYYSLPWPTSVLSEYYDASVSLKITLSWFIEPNPGALGSRYPAVYRSFGLKFDLQRPGESIDMFRSRVNANDAQEGKTKGPPDNNWLLGNKHSRAGSLICDIWKGSVAELLDRRLLCVSPRDGWWKNRRRAKRFADRGRYCLIVSLNAPSLPIDVHAELDTAIKAHIAAAVVAEVDVD